MNRRPGIGQEHSRHPLFLLFIVLSTLILLTAAYGCAPPAGSDENTISNEPGQGAPEAPEEQPEATSPPTEASATALPPEPSSTPGVSSNADWQPVAGELSGLAMVYVPTGCFTMGSSESQIAAAMEACGDLYSGAPFPCDPSVYQTEGPQHEVCPDAFWIGSTEVTNHQYAACVDAGVCSPPADRTAFDDPAYADYPVIQVMWADAMHYAEWVGGRLPTEAEWEYAARGPDGWVYPWGDTFEKDRLNYCDVNCDVYFWADSTYDDGYALTAPVGSYPAGASWVGALDMSGNAWEWVSSLYRDYPYDPSDGREDPGAAGDHVLRGGAFDLSYLDVRPAFRYVLPADGSCRGYGFRVAADAEAVTAP
jgi:formylglycine-generating enzyme required for sulfatase activity